MTAQVRARFYLRVWNWVYTPLIYFNLVISLINIESLTILNYGWHMVTKILVPNPMNIATTLLLQTASTTFSPHQMAMVATQLQPQSIT